MKHPTGESVDGPLRLDFDRRVHGSRIASDAGYRELDDALVLTAIAGDMLADARTGRNGRHALVGLLRQSVFGRLAGYEDVNDAERPRHANRVLQDRIGYLLKRPVGRPPNHVRRYYANFHYQAASWKAPRRVIAKVEWHPGELYPRIGFIVTNLCRPAERVVTFYNQHGKAEQWIKEGKGAIKWTRLSCRLPELASKRTS